MKFHFTPPQGWMNDPNGTIKIGDTYHLFYQHYPYDNIWGPMHWGHATSKDLLTWDHQPIALKPDDLGMIFSGCTILDTENLAGFGKNALIAMYTSHHPQTNDEQQSIAYSTDYVNFTTYTNNPVISNTPDLPSFKKDFRDPKIFKNPIKGGYSVALAATNDIDFYHTTDFIHWTKTGSFDAQQHGLKGICECPDCFYIDGHWVLFISKVIRKDMLDKELIEQGYKIRHTMEYYIGDFDGNTFIDTLQNDTPLLLDYGPDNYAMVSFGNTEPLTFIGWGESWEYIRQTPSTSTRGKATTAKTLKIVETDKGLRLATYPLENVPKTSYTIKVGQTLELEKLQIKVEEATITVTRPISDFCDFIKEPKHNTFTIPRYTDGDLEFTIIEDEGYYEIYTEHGLVPISIQTY